MSTAEWRAHRVLVAACVLAWVVVGGFLVGPQVEAYLAPFRIEQVVSKVARTVERLCWDASFRKARVGATDDLDVYLYAEGIEGRMVVALYGADDGMPWRVSLAAPVGPYRKRYCVDVPAGVPASATLRLEETVWYPGWLGLWRVPTHLPDVIGPPSG